MTDILNTKNMKKMENWWVFLCMILWQNLPLYSSLTNYTKISTSMRTFRETQHVYKTKEAWQFHITHALTSQPSARMRSEGYCVCLSVCLCVTRHLTSRFTNRSTNNTTYSASDKGWDFRYVRELWRETGAKEPICKLALAYRQ